MKRAPLLILAAFVCGYLTSPLRDWSAGAAQAETALPIADAHLHSDPELSPADLLSALDATGVTWAGLGVRRGDRTTWVALSAELQSRFIAFAGQTELNLAYFGGRDSCPGTPDRCGVAAMEDENNPIVQQLLRAAEEDLAAGRVKGIGEVFVNNINSAPQIAGFARKARADAPSIRRLYELASRYDGFLAVHMEPDVDSVAQLEALLASDPRGRVLWNHCGSRTTAAQARALLAVHPNLFCDLAVRYPPVLRNREPVRRVFDSAGLDPNWQQLLEEFSDRFLLGTDVLDGRLPDKGRGEFDQAIAIARGGLLARLSPVAARRVACENAQRLFRLIVPFDTMTAEAESRATEFRIAGTFAIGPCSNGLDPMTEEVLLRIGATALAVPARSLRETEPGRFEFDGIVGDVSVTLVIRATTDGGYSFSARAIGAALRATPSPIEVVVTIGDDSGTVAARPVA